MNLIGSNSSPYVRKVRIVLADKKIDYEYQPEDVFSPDAQVSRFNPLGKVPCLITDDGAAVFDSRVIVEYLDNLTPVLKLIPPSGRERLLVRCWEALADGLLDAALLVRLETTMRQEGERSATWVARQMGKIDAALAAMSRLLADPQWCCGDKYTLADIATGCALGYLDFRFGQLDWRAQHPALAALSDRLAARQPFIDTKPF
ncbi:MAG: glutathione S-transferase N-terminal domain-containing protein [Quisquiliibacterium sp.]